MSKSLIIKTGLMAIVFCTVMSMSYIFFSGRKPLRPLTGAAKIEVFDNLKREPSSQKPSTNPHIREGQSSSPPEFEIRKRVEILMPGESFDKETEALRDGKKPMKLDPPEH